MNINNLKENQIIKNYKELCTLLEINTTTGNAKKSQLKELDRYCEYHKEKTKFIINKIYKEPLPEVINLKNNKYSTYIEKLIIHMLSCCPINQDTKTISMSRNGLFLMLHFINENYTLGRNNINSFSRYLQIPTSILYEFYNSTSTKMKSTVERTLNKLQNEKLIKWENRTAVRLTNGLIRTATDEEVTKILEAERNTLIEFKEEDPTLENIQMVFLKGKWNAYNKKVNKLIQEYDILYYFKTYYIYTTKDFREMLLNEYDLLENQVQLNEQLYISTIESAKKHKDKIADKNKIEKVKYDNEKVVLLKEYEELIKKIADTVILDVGIDEIDLENYIDKVYTYKEYITELGWDKSINDDLEFERKWEEFDF